MRRTILHPWHLLLAIMAGTMMGSESSVISSYCADDNAAVHPVIASEAPSDF
jgi:hypothetical protein